MTKIKKKEPGIEQLKYFDYFDKIVEEFCGQSDAHKNLEQGGSLGLEVMGGDSCYKGRGFESWHHILSGHISLIFV